MMRVMVRIIKALCAIKELKFEGVSEELFSLFTLSYTRLLVVGKLSFVAAAAA